MTLTALLNKHYIKYFTEKELIDASSPIPVELYNNIIPPLIFADFLRKQLDFAMYIESAYRSPEHNKKVGGSKSSLHLKFNALDLHPLDKSKEKVEKMHEFVRQLDKQDFEIIYSDKSIKRSNTGIGYYNWGVHIDTRGILGYSSPARWDRRT